MTSRLQPLSALPRRASPFVLIALLSLLTTTACDPNRAREADLGTPFTLRLGQSAALADSGFDITFESVVRDGRCPALVECESHSPVIVVLTLLEPDGRQTRLEMNPEPAFAELGVAPSVTTVANIEISLLLVEPYPQVPEDLQSFDDYEVTILVTANASAAVPFSFPPGSS